MVLIARNFPGLGSYLTPIFVKIKFLPIVDEFKISFIFWPSRCMQRLDEKKYTTKHLYLVVIRCVQRINNDKDLGGYSVGVPPLPIPNREVKPDSADGTA